MWLSHRQPALTLQEGGDAGTAEDHTRWQSEARPAVQLLALVQCPPGRVACAYEGCRRSLAARCFRAVTSSKGSSDIYIIFENAGPSCRRFWFDVSSAKKKKFLRRIYGLLEQIRQHSPVPEEQLVCALNQPERTEMVLLCCCTGRGSTLALFLGLLMLQCCPSNRDLTVPVM